MKGGLRKRLLALCSVLAITAGMVALFISQPLFLRQLDNRVYDFFLLTAPRPEPSAVPVIIDIDEEALAEYGQWPWPRYRLALLLQAAAERGAAAVALDVLLAEPDRTSPRNMRLDLSKDLRLQVEFRGLPSEMLDYDRLLADVIRDYPVVLGMYARFEESAPAPGGLPRGVSNIERSRPGDRPILDRVHRAAGATVPLQVLSDAAPVGLINMSPDSDGFVRRVPMLTAVEDKIYVNLALRALMRAEGRANIFSVSGPDGLESLRVGGFDIPVSPEGNFTVPFTGPRGEYPYVSAARLLDGSLPSDAFAGKILFVGTSAPGLLDIRATPFDRVYPGVEVHAAVLDAVLSGRSISAPSWIPGLLALVIVATGLTAGLAFSFARPRVYLAAGLLLLALILGGSWQLFGAGMFVSPLYPALTVALQGSLMLLLRFWQEERQKLTLRRAFSRYVAPEVVRRITEHRGDLMSGEERELSIMFTDIRGFTAISERLDPRQVVSLLGRYFTPMTALVRESQGTLDKFIGDALMAFWNAPLDVPDHAPRAVETALRMLETLGGLNGDLERDFGCRINMGAGLHTGKVYVGNMGSADLVNYTLIGDNVNLTSRLEGLCALYGLGTVLSADTVRRCLETDPERFAFQPVDTLRVKGREQPVRVYTALRPHEYQARAEEFAQFSAALELYRQADFSGAQAAFGRLAERCPACRVYTVYLERLAGLLRTPPPEWDGVWRLGNK